RLLCEPASTTPPPSGRAPHFPLAGGRPAVVVPVSPELSRHVSFAPCDPLLASAVVSAEVGVLPSLGQFLIVRPVVHTALGNQKSLGSAQANQRWVAKGL